MSYIASTVAVLCAAFGQAECVAGAESIALTASLIGVAADLLDAAATGHLNRQALLDDGIGAIGGGLGKAAAKLNQIGKLSKTKLAGAAVFGLAVDEYGWASGAMSYMPGPTGQGSSGG